MDYVRTTDSIQISASNPLTAEHGHWAGRFQRTDGVQTVQGVYLAQRKEMGEGWKIRSEIFVTLSCTGSVECGK